MFATAEQLAVLLWGFVTDDPNDRSTALTHIQSLLNDESVIVESEWNKLYNRSGNNPAPAQPDPNDLDNPPTIINLLLEMLTIETVLAEYIAIRTKLTYQVFFGQYNMMKKVASERRAFFRSGKLNPGILKQLRGEIFPIDPFVEIQESADSDGFLVTADTNPSSSTTLRINQRETAWVRLLAGRSGRNPQDLLTMADKTKLAYKSLVKPMASAQVSRIAQTPLYTSEKDAIIVTQMKKAWEAQQVFATGNFRLPL